MNETGQSSVVADDHLPPPSDLTLGEALAQLKELIERILSILPK